MAKTKKKIYAVTGDPVGPPTHPGAILREDVLPALEVSVSEAARELGITRQTLHRILAETHPVSAEMAVRLGKWCGNGPGIWSRLQAAWDVWNAEQELKKTIAKIRTRNAAA